MNLDEIEPLIAHKVGQGCCAPIFNIKIMPSFAEEAVLVERAKVALVNEIVRELGADGLVGFKYRLSTVTDPLYGCKTVAVDSHVGQQRYAIALRYLEEIA